MVSEPREGEEVDPLFRNPCQADGLVDEESEEGKTFYAKQNSSVISPDRFSSISTEC